MSLLRYRASKGIEFVLAALLLTGCALVQPAGSTATPVEPAGEPIGETAAPVTQTSVPTPWPTNTPSATPVSGKVVVDASVSLGKIDPLVYGTNVGPWQDLSPKQVERIAEAGFTLLRFPGGNYGDEVYIPENRIDEFIALCRKVGAEPMINVRLFKSTPEKAADMVRYVNVTKGYGVKYWGIGNEPDLYSKNRGLKGYDTVQFNRDWRAFAEAMKAVDPTIQLIGPETSQYTAVSYNNPKDEHGKDWMTEFLKANGDLVDIVSIHRYPFGSSDPLESELLKSSGEWDAILSSLRSLVRSTTGRDLPLAVTEVNSNWSNRKGNPTTPDAFINAVWWADALGRMIKNQTAIVAQFAIAGDGGWSLLKGSEPRPAFAVHLMYRQFGTELVYAASGIDNLSVYAARNEAGALTVLLVNRNRRAVEAPVDLKNFDPAPSADVTLLDQDHFAESSPALAINEGINVKMPAESVILLVIPAK